MNRLLLLLSLKPILLGLIGMIISGFSFPLAGVIILRNNLISMRYMLMHGVILGGIFAIVLNLPMIIVVCIVNIILVLIMMALKKGRKTTLSVASTAMMVCTMSLASLFSHIFDVPAKDTLELLWGSPFALTVSDLIILCLLSVVICSYIGFCFTPLSMIFFDDEIASSCGVNVKLHNYLMVMITALIISVAMKLVGALLIDALVILPVVAACKTAKSLKSLFIQSSVLGFVLSVAGYFAALMFNLPVSGVLAMFAVVAYIVSSVIKKVRK